MNQGRRSCLRTIVCGAMAVVSPGAVADDEVLSPEEAFRVSARRVAPSVIEVAFQVEPGYQLYTDRLRFATDSPAVSVLEVALPEAMERFDPVLEERVRYFSRDFVARVSLSHSDRELVLTLSMQGCSPEFGICFPPGERAFRVPPSQERGAA